MSSCLKGHSTQNRVLLVVEIEGGQVYGRAVFGTGTGSVKGTDVEVGVADELE